MDVHKPLVTLTELAQLVDGRVVGAGETLICDALPLQDAGVGCLTLADSPKQLQRVQQSQAAAVLTPCEIQGCSIPMLIVGDIHGAFKAIIRELRPQVDHIQSGISASANLHSTARIGAETTIGPGVSIGADCVIGARCTIHASVHIQAGCHLGNDCELFPGVVLYPSTRLGDRVTIHANASLGAYGFGYKTVDGRHVRTAQLGWVEVADDVEIGALSAVDRGTYGPTKIGAGTKIDNCVQIGHNCHIGENNLICAQVGIAGSCTTQDNVVIAGQVGIADHLLIGARAQLAAKSGVMQDVSPGQVLAGIPAIDCRQKMQEVAMVARLPDMRRDLKSMQKQLEELTRKLELTQAELKCPANTTQRDRNVA